MLTLPWWATLAVKALITVLQPLLDKAIGTQLEQTVTGIILHVIGAGTPASTVISQSMAIENVRGACEGVGCGTGLKKD